jgi:hypothetical protein
MRRSREGFRENTRDSGNPSLTGRSRNQTGVGFPAETQKGQRSCHDGVVVEWAGKPGLLEPAPAKKSELRSDAQGGALCHWAPRIFKK